MDGYIQHRLNTADGAVYPVFSREALDSIAARAQGVPARINLLCRSAIAVAKQQGRSKIDGDLMKKVARAAGLPAASHVDAEVTVQEATGRQSSAQPEPSVEWERSATAEASDHAAVEASTADLAEQAPAASRSVWRRLLLPGAVVAGCGAIFILLQISTPRENPCIAAPVVQPDSERISATTVAPPSQPLSTPPAVVPSPPTAAVPPSEPRRAAAGSGSTAEAVPSSGIEAAETFDPAAMLARGEKQRAQGDYAGARLWFRFAAERGSAKAARSLARTFDPEVMA